MPCYGQVIVAQQRRGNWRACLWYATLDRADVVVEVAISFGLRALPVSFTGHALVVYFEDSFHANIEVIRHTCKLKVFIFVESAAIFLNVAFFWVGREWVRIRIRTWTWWTLIN